MEEQVYLLVPIQLAKQLEGMLMEMPIPMKYAQQILPLLSQMSKSPIVKQDALKTKENESDSAIK